MQIAMTVQQQIDLAASFPKVGSQERMSMFVSLRKKIACWANAQLINYRIVEVDDTYVTALPDTTQLITLDDDLVLKFAEYIKELDTNHMVKKAFASIYQQVLDEAEALQAAAETESDTTEESEE